MQQHFQIIGSGHALPSETLSAEMVDEHIGRPKGWTREHVGVLTRHVCSGTETLATIGRDAVRIALKDAKLDIGYVDLLIDASTSRHQPIPSNGPAILRELGAAADGLSCLDVHHSCLSFVMAMQVANGLLGIDACERILIVSAEACLAAANWQHAESASILGDGAAAVVLARAPARDHFAFRHETLPQYFDACGVRGGAHVQPPFEYTQENDADYRFWMDGKRLLRIAKKHLPSMFATVVSDADVDKQSVHVIPHQASPTALLGVRRWLKIDPSHFYSQGVVEHGNVGAAGIPITLDRTRRTGLINPGDPIMLLGTAAGYSQGGMIFTL